MSKIRASHILCKTKPEADEIIGRMKTGEPIEKLATDKSICPSGKRGGDLGSFGRGMMVREFEKAAFDLDVGQITLEPVKTDFGWHIIKRTG